MHRGRHIDEALFAGAAEGSAVRVGRTEVGVPGVQVRIEVEDGDLAVRLVQGAQVGQGQGVVTTEGEQLGPIGAHGVGVGFDGGDGLFDVERVDAEVTAVGDLLPGERVDVRGLVVGTQQLRGLADVSRSETGAGTVADAGVEGDADDFDVDLLAGALGFDLVDARQQSERRGSCVAGCLAVVGWAERLRRHWLSPSSWRLTGSGRAGGRALSLGRGSHNTDIQSGAFDIAVIQIG